ncbi:small ribosomal subunit protein eS19z-like [Malus domestica]|uniref:small ribosomal subunit protein eS19z-like n=1 Tax=Malus domestica TaxID=3750 RepID=UPI0039761C5D
MTQVVRTAWIADMEWCADLEEIVYLSAIFCNSLRFACSFDVCEQVELPPWTYIVKTTRFKELAPYDPDWYYVRAASMARKIYLRGGLGVGAFRRIYGGSQRNGSRPPHFCESSGAIARHILQQLQKMNIVDVDPKGGRRITSSGQCDLDHVAGRIVVTP